MFGQKYTQTLPAHSWVSSCKSNLWLVSESNNRDDWCIDVWQVVICTERDADGERPLRATTWQKYHGVHPDTITGYSVVGVGGGGDTRLDSCFGSEFTLTLSARRPGQSHHSTVCVLNVQTSCSVRGLDVHVGFLTFDSFGFGFTIGVLLAKSMASNFCILFYWNQTVLIWTDFNLFIFCTL